MQRSAVVIFAVLFCCRPAMAQHGFVAGGPYDASVPTPVSVLGYQLGDRFTPHHEMLQYIARVAAASKRVHVDTVARTFEGRELLSVVITSESNRARLAEIRADAQRLADPRGTAQNELGSVVARMPSIVWLGYTVHGGEASGAEAALALIYQLAAGQDAATKMILDSTVVLIDPLQNPDGHERHVQDVMRARGAFGPQSSPLALVHRGSWPGPRTNHYYFDMNRDYFVQSQPETRGRIKTFLTWHPHVAVDLHEMGFNSTYFFPPAMDPVNKIVPRSVVDWWSIYANANAAAFDERGWGYFRREGYDEFFPGYGSSWPLYAGAVGMTYEQASSNGGAIRRTDGTVLTLRDAAAHHYTTSWTTALTTAQRRSERVRDFLKFRQAAISEALRTPVRAVVFARDPQGRGDSLAQRLLDNGIEVHRSTAALGTRATPFATTTGTSIPLSAYVVDFAQPLGRLARAILEPDAQLDSVFIREELEHREQGLNNRFYDLTAWALPYMYRVHAWTLAAAPANVERVTAIGALPPAQLTNARHGYAFEPGSDAAIRMLAGLLRDSVRVHYAQRWFKQNGKVYPHGAFVVRVVANDGRVHDLVRKHAGASGAQVVVLNSGMVEEGTDLGSNTVLPVRNVRVALVAGPGISGNSFGSAWYTFDQRMQLPVTNIDISSLGALDEFNVVVLPSGSFDQVSESSRDRLREWVRSGGVLITLDNATRWIAAEKGGLIRMRVRVDSVRPDSQPGAPLPAAVPGAIVRVRADTLSLLSAGIDEREFAALVFSDRVYTTPKDFAPGEVVLKFAAGKTLRIAGYMWPEVPARLADSPYLWTERLGRGRVIAFTGDPNFRDMWRGMYVLFANAVLLGQSF